MINSISGPQATVSSPLVTRERAAARTVDTGRDSPAAPPAPPGSALSVEELRQIDALQATDRQVRTHELAHMAAGAGLTGGATFTYQVGPDHQRYAVGGEVSIDTSPGKDPAATLDKALQIRAAALAPADPSPQDQKVAAQASQMAGTARLELIAQENGEPSSLSDLTPAKPAHFTMRDRKSTCHWVSWFLAGFPLIFPTEDAIRPCVSNSTPGRPASTRR